MDQLKKIFGVDKYYSFKLSVPPPNAKPLAVQKWIRTWFSERDIVLSKQQDDAIYAIWWDGHDLRHYKELHFARQLEAMVVFRLYAPALAHDISQARDFIKVEKGDVKGLILGTLLLGCSIWGFVSLCKLVGAAIYAFSLSEIVGF